MAPRTIARITCFFTLSLTMTLVGCGTIAGGGTVRMKSETELAVSEISEQWLTKCEGVTSPAPDNQVGLLLQDYNDLAVALANCMTRNNGLVDYLKPLVKKERGNP